MAMKISQAGRQNPNRNGADKLTRGGGEIKPCARRRCVTNGSIAEKRKEFRSSRRENPAFFPVAAKESLWRFCVFFFREFHYLRAQHEHVSASRGTTPSNRLASATPA